MAIKSCAIKSYLLNTSWERVCAKVMRPRPRFFQGWWPVAFNIAGANGFIKQGLGFQRGNHTTAQRLVAARMSFSISWALSVTLRKRSECVPTRPTVQVPSPLARRVSTRIGSLKSEPNTMQPSCIRLSEVVITHQPSVP